MKKEIAKLAITMAIADEVMDYLHWDEIDLDLIEPMYTQIIYEKICKQWE